jgi:hypothetical protein
VQAVIELICNRTQLALAVNLKGNVRRMKPFICSIEIISLGLMFQKVHSKSCALVPFFVHRHRPGSGIDGIFGSCSKAT